MKFIARCIDSIERRPFVFGSLFLFFLILSYLEQFVYSLYKSLLSSDISNLFSFFLNTNSRNTADLGNAVAGTAVSESTITVGSVLLGILVGGLLLFAFSAILSTYFSGYFHVLNLSLQSNKEKAPGDFRRGLLKHYFKFTLYIFLHVVILVAVAVGAIFAMFPAKLSFDMVYSGGNNGLLLVSIFLILLSAIVISFIASIILMYTFYLYPSLVCFKKGSGYMAKKVVNAKFWYILPRLMCFVILYGVWQYILVRIEYGLVSFQASIAIFILNAIIKTYLVFALLFFVFFTFRQIKNVLQVEEDTPEDATPKKTPPARRSGQPAARRPAGRVQQQKQPASVRR